MSGKKIVRKFVTLSTLATLWCVYSMVAFAMPGATAADITVTGQVTVNGQPAVSGSTIMSGAVITTAGGSSAVVSLGKLGRVEIQENSNLSLTFADNSIAAVLNDGKAQFSTAAGVATSVATKHQTAIADSSQADNFSVQTACANTYVDTTSGVVNMREGATDKQVVAGSSAMAGTMGQTGCKPCLRPNSTPGPSIAGWPWLLAAAAGAAGVAIYFGTKGDDRTDLGGGVVVVSPSR